MPLDDDVIRYLEARAAEDDPPLGTVPVERLRADDRAFFAALPRAAVAEVRGVDVPGPAGPIPARLYHPSPGTARPLLVLFHGGGFVFGDLETHDPTARRFAAEGDAAVLSVDYRLAPEHPFPAGVDDAEAATRWAVDHAAELGGDPERVVVSGDSAGGNLAAVVALRLRDAGGPSLAGQLLIYPTTDMRTGDRYPSKRELAEGYGLSGHDMDWFGQQYIQDAGDLARPDASPMAAADLSGLPPAFVLTAEYDPLRDEGDAYAERLAEAGVAVEHVRLLGAIHGVQTIPEPLRSGEELWRRSLDWLRRTVGGGAG
jgi:acetyl esterase